MLSATFSWRKDYNEPSCVSMTTQPNSVRQMVAKIFQKCYCQNLTQRDRNRKLTKKKLFLKIAIIYKCAIRLQ